MDKLIHLYEQDDGTFTAECSGDAPFQDYVADGPTIRETLDSLATQLEEANG